MGLQDLARQRAEMIERQLRGRGIRDDRVLGAMRSVPREAFVPPDLVEYAYYDAPLPIGEGQTISQPYMVAYMAEAAEIAPGDVVLDVGTGSGYAAAVLAEMAAEVYTIEANRALAEAASARLRRLGYASVEVRHGDGSLGWPENAPYDAILVAASAPEVPQPLLAQLSEGGRLVLPTGPTRRMQTLVRVRRRLEEVYETERLASVQFVPLVGRAGWKTAPPRED